MSDFLLHREVNPWNWLLLGRVGTLLVGSQVMKLIMEGIHLIFLSRPAASWPTFILCIDRGMARGPRAEYLRPAIAAMDDSRIRRSPFIRGFWSVMLPVLAKALAMLVLTLIYRVARRRSATWSSVLPGSAAATILWWGVNLLI